MVRVNFRLASRWDSHKARWYDCQKCPLQRSRSNVVLARGSLPCQVLFIGEAPGDSEDSLREPFVGSAGQLLDSMIAEAATEEGIKLPRMAFTNVVCCRPARKPDGQFEQPTKQEAKACSPRLSEFIRIAQPNVIILVGRVAEKYQPKDYYFQGIKQFAIIHPAAILRKNDNVSYHRVIIKLRAVFRDYL